MASQSEATRTLETLNWDNEALRALPVEEPEVWDESRPSIRGVCFSRVRPTPVRNPQLVCASSALELIDLDPAEVNRPEFAEYFSGNKIFPGSQPAAHCYCGHQFGYFSGQLGDGATMYLGEIINHKGERWEIQFKGAGKTPYSRSADGRKVLRSSIREFLCSEAMHYLGVPTTRAGTVVTSDSRVLRDIFYNGNAREERCSIITRLAPTFLRFGSFEIFLPTSHETGRRGPSQGLEGTLLPQMLRYALSFFPSLHQQLDSCPDPTDLYEQMFAEVVDRTARLVAHWQAVGFCHGVMNTDNMSLLGLTLDYGPFGFMESFDPDFVCNGSDNGGRYSYARQPPMARWNLRRFAIALSPALPLERSERHLERFDPLLHTELQQRMRNKLGLMTQQEGDEGLVEGFLGAMRETGGDFSNSFRCLSGLSLPPSAEEVEATLEFLVAQSLPLSVLIKRARPSIPAHQLRQLAELAKRDPRMLALMGVEPEMIDGEMKKLAGLKALQAMNPTEKTQKDRQVWQGWLGRYVDRLRLEAETFEPNAQLGNSLAELDLKRKLVMNSNNPKYVLRNYIAQNAIARAEEGDFREVARVLRVLQDPYGLSESEERRGRGSSSGGKRAAAGEGETEEEEEGADFPPYDSAAPAWAADLCVT